MGAKNRGQGTGDPSTLSAEQWLSARQAELPAAWALG